MSTSFIGGTSPTSQTEPVTVEEYLRSSYEPDCDYVDGYLEERNVGEIDHSRLQRKLLRFLEDFARAVLTEYPGAEPFPELRMRVSATRFRVPDVCLFLEDPGEPVPSTPPFLCIEVLSPEDRMSRVEIRINDFLAMGVAYVWVIDPETKQAYCATAEEGLREVKDGVLRTESPEIRMPLSKLF